MMNKILFTVTLLVAICVSCQKEIKDELPDSVLKTDSTNLLLSATAGGKDSFNIQSNTKWEITVQPATADWLITDITSGTGNAKVIVSVAKSNPTDTVQKAKIIITPVNNSSVQPVMILVSQSKPAIKTRNAYGGTDMDEFYSVVATDDGGYIAVGTTNSKNGDVSGLHGNWEDAWVIKIDAKGDKVWQKTLGGSDRDGALNIIKTNDGNFLILAGAGSVDGDLTGLGDGAWLIKMGKNGNVIWQKRVSNAGAAAIIPAAGGGYMLLGNANSSSGFSDYQVTKITDDGNKIWQKTYGGTGADAAYSIVAASDNGYIIAGSAQSNDGDVTGNHGFDDFWIVKIDDNGNKVWQKSYGGTNVEFCNSITKTNDGGYVIAGITESNDGDVSGNHGSSDNWVIKIDAAGNKVWQKTLGGSNQERAYHILSTSDGGLLVSGLTWSSDGDVASFHGATDAWVVKLGSNGNKIWEKTLGGTDEEWINFALEVTPNNYVLVGATFSDDIDVVGLHGYGDAWLMKLN
jgi:hypothetical protein